MESAPFHFPLDAKTQSQDLRSFALETCLQLTPASLSARRCASTFAG